MVFFKIDIAKSYVTSEHKWKYPHVYTGCPGGNVPDFGRLFLKLKYTDLTQKKTPYPKSNGYGDNGERSLKV